MSLEALPDSSLTLEPHPRLCLHAFFAHLPAPLEELPSPPWLLALLSPSATAPFSPDEQTRAAVRDLLRVGGYKPTGRGKPASEYLARIASGAGLGSINLAVDACNAASLHGGLPISVLDLDRTIPPLRVGTAPTGESYVFNAAGQVIDLSGLLCLFDGQGPCANAVKDSQRTKTRAGTRRLLALVWGDASLGPHPGHVAAWFRQLLERAGARCAVLHTSSPPNP